MVKLRLQRKCTWKSTVVYFKSKIKQVQYKMEWMLSGLTGHKVSMNIMLNFVICISDIEF